MRYVLAVASGVLFAAAFPDISIGWIAFVAFVPLLTALSRARRGADAFLLGWISQTTAWLIMVPWVVRVMAHYGGLPWITGVLIFIAMALYLGLFGGWFGFLVYRRWYLAPLAWAAVEYARTYLLTGFPWNLIATSIVDYTPLIQLDRFAGPYFIGAMILLPSTVIAWFVTRRPRGFAAGIAIAGVIVVMFVWWGTGLVASKLVVRPTGAAPAVAAMLQPNISQEMRWDTENMLQIFDRMMQMTGEAIRNGATVVIWPESTVPLSYSSTEFFREAIESVSRTHNVDIILGSVAEDPENANRIWNAAFLVSGGKTAGHYDKIRLVPFGEYVPLRKMLFFARKLVHAVGEFEFGTSDNPLRGKFSYGPAICYEIVYPQIARTQVRHGANVLVTITNDAWFDGTSAPAQHLAQARLRAVEDDRYLLRAATTGISAFVDPAGQLLKALPMGTQGIVYAEFHPRTGMTPYVRFGDWFAWLAVGAVVVPLVRGRREC